MPVEYKVIGRQIRAARVQKQMTQEAVAEAIEMSCAHYGKIERGERPINLHRLSQLSALLDTPLEALIEGAAVTDTDTSISRTNLTDHAEFLAAMKTISKGCSEASLRLMLRLCATVAEEDKAKPEP